MPNTAVQNTGFMLWDHKYIQLSLAYKLSIVQLINSKLHLDKLICPKD